MGRVFTLALKMYKGVIRVETPVHITGSELSKFEYYMDGDDAVLYDIDSVTYNSLYRMHQDLGEMLEKVSIQDLEFDVKQYVEGSREVRRIRFEDGGNKDVKLMTFQNGMPYMPGSTIKGWIRKAYVVNALKNDHKTRKYFESRAVGKKHMIDVLFARQLPGKNPQYQDIFRHVSVSDAFPAGDWETEILKVEKWGRSRGGKPTPVPIYAEFITRGEFEFTLSIPEDWDITDITGWSNDFFGMIRQHENFTTDNVRQLLFPIPESMAMILGRFSGILTKTVLVLGFGHAGYDYLFDLAISIVKSKNRPNRKLIQSLKYMKSHGRRRNPLYVEHEGKNKFPGIVDVSFEPLGDTE